MNILRRTVLICLFLTSFFPIATGGSPRPNKAPLITPRPQGSGTNDAQEPIENELGRAVGFICGQRFSLQRIKEKYPELSPRIQKAEADFKLAFGKSEDNMTNALRAILQDGYGDFEKALNEQLIAVLTSQPITLDGARLFIEEVEARAAGRLQSPIIETILAYQYLNSPAEEFLAGFSREYRTGSHKNAKGIDALIKVPVSWKAREGEHPNVVQIFVSENGRGNESVVILANDIDLPRDYQMTKEDLDEIYSESGLKEMIPDDAKFISASRVTFDNQTAGIIVYDVTLKGTEPIATQRHRSLVLVRGTKMLFIQCTVTAVTGKSTLHERFQKFESLFELVGKSVHLPVAKDSGQSLFVKNETLRFTQRPQMGNTELAESLN